MLIRTTTSGEKTTNLNIELWNNANRDLSIKLSDVAFFDQH